MVRIGEVLLVFRQRHKVSRRKVAQHTGIAASTIRYIENGRIDNPGWQTVCTLFAYFGCQPVFAIHMDAISQRNNIIPVEDEEEDDDR